MEDITNQPSTADASLYNGQPFDTGLSCQSAELTFRTPSISKDIRNGVSVENVPLRNKQWFVLRVSYGRIFKAKAFVEAKGFECYVPIRYKEIKEEFKTLSFNHVSLHKKDTKMYQVIFTITMVLVTEEKFKDIHGRVAKIAGQHRVVMELFEGYLVATAYIPKDVIKIIKN